MRQTRHPPGPQPTLKSTHTRPGSPAHVQPAVRCSETLFANDDNGTLIVSVPGETSADGFAPRAIASFRASDNLTLNAQASRGIRLGGINDPLNVPLCTPEDSITFSGRDFWRDETAWNYEVGTKSRMLVAAPRSICPRSIWTSATFS
jgi:outer membrane receptor protein involved in Fe transport